MPWQGYTSLPREKFRNKADGFDYGTVWPLTENPISGGGIWTSGGTVALDWAQVRTTPGKVFGTQTGNGNDGLNTAPNKYDDSIAFLSIPEVRDYIVDATIFNNEISGNWNSEVEILLRGSMAAHYAAFYECNVRVKVGANVYAEIVRLNGPIGDFTYLAHEDGVKAAIVTGDRFKASIVGPLISVYLNDVLVAQASDSTYRTGAPGVGFYLNNQGATGDASRYGFSDLTVQAL